MSNTSHRRLEAALEAVLVFHQGSPWTANQKNGQTPENKWQCLIMEATENRIRPGEATTRILCNAIRDVLEIKSTEELYK